MHSFPVMTVVVFLIAGALSAFDHVRIGTLVVATLGLIMLGLAVSKRFMR